MRYRVRRADPAGNITLYVLDAVDAASRPALAARLIKELPDWKIEQVGFVCPPHAGTDGRFEMMGGEFCGNATRAYGMLLARDRGLAAPAHLLIETSGCDHPVAVDVDPKAGTSRAQMPLPGAARRYTAGGVEGVLVDLGGIVHFVVQCAPDESLMDAVEPICNAPREQGGFAGVEAYGVIFLHDAHLTPLVKVPAAGTLVWEGSCGSGSLAAAVALGFDPQTADGTFAGDFVQPAGVIRAEIAWHDHAIDAAYIGGSVALDEPVTVEI